MVKLYQQSNKIDLSSEEFIITDEGFVRAKVEYKNIQKIKRGKRKMMTPLIARYPVYGVVKTHELVATKGLDKLMEEMFTLQFHNFIKVTLCELMDEFGVISTTDSLYSTLQETHQTLLETKISIPSLKKYMKLLREVDVYRKINNKMIVINPYQLYKDASIGGDKLWQLQANWDIGKIMTHWLDLTTEERLELVKTKADLDKAWADKEIKELGLSDEKMKILTDNIPILKPIVNKFIIYYAKESDSLKLTMPSFIEYISNDKGARHFVSWWNRCYKNDKQFGITFKLDYILRNKYCKYIVKLLEGDIK